MPTIRYAWIGSGADSVKGMFRSIADEANRSAGVVAGSYGGQERAAKKAGDTGARAAEHAAAATEKAAQKKAAADDKYYAKVKANYDRIEGVWERALAKEVAAHEAAAAKKIAADEKAAKRLGDSRRKQLTSLGSQAFMSGATALGSMATSFIEKVVIGAFEVSGKANSISIMSRAAGAKAIDPSILEKEMYAAAKQAPGIKASEIGAGIEKYISLTGDSATARAGAGTFATVASATGSKVEDVAATAASIGEKFDVKGVEEMQKSMAILTFQGKQGAFELKDMAGQFQRLASAADSFDIGKGTQAVALLGGLTQVARTGTGNAHMATTAVENVFTALTQNSGKLKGHGVNVYDKDGKRRNVADVLAETVAGVGGTNLEAKNAGLSKIFGRQGIRAINPLLAAYTEASASAGGGKEGQAAGKQAVLDTIAKFSQTAGDWSEIQKDAAQAQETASAQLTGAWEQVTQKVSAELVPALAKLVPKILPLVDGIDPVITIFVALAESAGLVIDAFKWLGLIKPKVDSKLDQRKAAEAELDAFNKANTGPLTDEEEAKRNALEDQFFGADAAAYQPQRGRMTSEEFAAEYANVAGKKPGDENYDAFIKKGRDVEASIRADPMADNTDGGMGDATKALVQSRQDEQVQKNGEMMASMAELNAKVLALAASIEGASKKIGGAGQGGSIVSGSTN